MNAHLSHNPYKIETVFRIEDKACEAPWFIELTKQGGVPSRLQMWIGCFFDKLHENYPDETTFCLTYKGTTADCRDIQEEADLAAKRLGIEIRVNSIPCGDPASKFQQLRELYKEAVSGPYEDFHAVELHDDFKRIENRLLSVSIMAPMKNGKSTLLNAILGRDLLPNATLRTTAKISFIEHDEGMEDFEAKDTKVNGESSPYRPCDSEVLAKWNGANEVLNVRIRGSLPGIKAKGYHLQFVDTPGPDSAVHKEDRTTIIRFLNDHTLPMVCYIIARVNESEESYLNLLKEHMSRFGKQSEDRFIFVVSRMDQIDVPKASSKSDNPIKQTIDAIREDLKRLGISNPRIFPLSGKIALKAREYRMLDEEDQEEFQADFKKFQRGLKRIDSTLLDFTSVSSAIRKEIEDEMDAIRARIENGTDTAKDNLRLAELLSGVPALEMAIEEYGEKYSIPARIYDAATIFDQGIKKANAIDVLATELSAHETSLEEIRRKIDNIRRFLSKGEEARKMREEMFPRKWAESPSLKTALSGAECEFDTRISRELSNWSPKTLDEKGTIEPREAKELSDNFINYMNGLSAEMLGVYANHVEDDARVCYRNLKVDYETKIKDILGEMPKDLQDFIDNVRPVLSPGKIMDINMNEFITIQTETYTETVKRDITLRKDGFWAWVTARLPFTDTTTTETRTKYRDVERIKYHELKSKAKLEASTIIQEGIEKAEAAAKDQYGKLREKMMMQFDEIESKLKSFENDLDRSLEVQEGEVQMSDKYSDILKWVKEFQGKLDRVLDLEA